MVDPFDVLTLIPRPKPPIIDPIPIPGPVPVPITEPGVLGFLALILGSAKDLGGTGLKV